MILPVLDELMRETRSEITRGLAMRRGRRPCAFCGQLLDRGEMCLHHTLIFSESWARANRIFCDFFHRKIVLPTDTPAVGDVAVLNDVETDR